MPGVVVDVWKELLRLLQGKQLTSLLLQHMLTAMLSETDPSSLSSMMLAAWLRLVLLYEAANCECKVPRVLSWPFNRHGTSPRIRGIPRSPRKVINFCFFV